MLVNTETMNEDLGIFSNIQKNFKLLSGHRRMHLVISEFCRSLYPQNVATEMSPNVTSQSVAPQQVEPSHDILPNPPFRLINRRYTH